MEFNNESVEVSKIGREPFFCAEEGARCRERPRGAGGKVATHSKISQEEWGPFPTITIIVARRVNVSM